MKGDSLADRLDKFNVFYEENSGLGGFADAIRTVGNRALHRMEKKYGIPVAKFSFDLRGPTIENGMKRVLGDDEEFFSIFDGYRAGFPDLTLVLNEDKSIYTCGHIHTTDFIKRRWCQTCKSAMEEANMYRSLAANKVIDFGVISVPFEKLWEGNNEYSYFSDGGQFACELGRFRLDLESGRIDFE